MPDVTWLVTAAGVVLIVCLPWMLSRVPRGDYRPPREAPTPGRSTVLTPPD